MHSVVHCLLGQVQEPEGWEPVPSVASTCSGSPQTSLSQVILGRAAAEDRESDGPPGRMRVFELSNWKLSPLLYVVKRVAHRTSSLRDVFLHLDEGVRDMLLEVVNSFGEFVEPVLVHSEFVSRSKLSLEMFL